jgi:hypothetical protein
MISFDRSLPFPYLKWKEDEAYEKTSSADAEAMKYLSWALFPLVIGYSIYSLYYENHKSWYSWILGSLVGSVYTFGIYIINQASSCVSLLGTHWLCLCRLHYDVSSTILEL